MNDNPQHPDALLVAALAGSVFPTDRRLGALMVAATPLIGARAAFDLAASVVARVDDGADVEEAMGAAIEHRMARGDVYPAWRDVSLSLAVSICAAMWGAWKEIEA